MTASGRWRSGRRFGTAGISRPTKDGTESIKAFRVQHGLTQADVAAVVGAESRTSVTQWEQGVRVPDGIRRERVKALLEGQLWPEVRAATMSGNGLPESWELTERWYRRASRERRPRETVGAIVAAVLGHVGVVNTVDSLRQHYCAHDADRVPGVAAQCGQDGLDDDQLRQVERAAYGLRWLELVHRSRFDLSRSLVPQLPLTLFDAEESKGRLHVKGFADA